MLVSRLAAAVLFCAASAWAGTGEACQLCHEDVVKQFPAIRHSTQQCEGCHGSSAKHADSGEPADIRSFHELGPAAIDRACLSCHRNGITHAGRIAGGHARNQVACTSCHSVHQPLKVRTAVERTQLCSSCHPSVRAEFAKPHRHRVPEGPVSCTDCHNPHARPLAQPVRLAVNEPGCLTCHGDKRGPFAFEHAPVKLSSCSTCHEPHGSANPRMLIRHEVRLVCLECHSNVGARQQVLGTVPPAFHDLESPRYRNCTVCHVRIHGSHTSRALLR